mmetsp:Transcript_20025/g.50810  ORF Transcript_20025/g.50810 Transcript_20025/m.50810 type:complete len:287 (-) Transcript_20025:535-1395(-)
MADWPPTEQEERINGIFLKVDKLFKKATKTKDPDKIHQAMKNITDSLKEAKALLKEFEREARADGMPVPMLQERKKAFADQLNTYIQQRKEIGTGAVKDELFAGAVKPQEENIEQMSMQQLMQRGKRDWEDTEATLARAERLVEDTEQIGVQTAGAIHDQTKQLNKIVDDLNDIEFNVKKASKVITDITRGMLTDKCIGFLLFMAIAGVIVIIVLKVVNPNKSKIAAAADALCNTTIAGVNICDSVTSAANQAQDAVQSGASSAGLGRRLLREILNNGTLLADDDW